MTKSTLQSLSGDRTNSVMQPLANLEKALETPIIPGELDSWLSTVCDAASALHEILAPTYEQTHQGLFREMCAQDSGMLARVDQLKRDDAAIVALLHGFLTDITGIQTAFDEPEVTETELRERLQILVDGGIAFVVRARTQETAIATWYAEAFDRDCGNKD